MTSFTVYLAFLDAGPHVAVAVQAASQASARRFAILYAARALRRPVAGVVRVEGAASGNAGALAQAPSAKIFRLAA